MKVKIKVNTQVDRDDLVLVLANNGYPVTSREIDKYRAEGYEIEFEVAQENIIPARTFMDDISDAMDRADNSEDRKQRQYGLYCKDCELPLEKWVNCESLQCPNAYEHKETKRSELLPPYDEEAVEKGIKKVMNEGFEIPSRDEEDFPEPFYAPGTSPDYEGSISGPLSQEEIDWMLDFADTEMYCKACNKTCTAVPYSKNNYVSTAASDCCKADVDFRKKGE